VPRARALRREATEAEKNSLRQPPFKERHFRVRQRSARISPTSPVIGPKLSSRSMAVNISGSASDEVRTRYLEANGYRVLRFWNNDVLENMSGVLSRIDAAVNADRPPTLDPSPPQAGGGE
jgi:very-short-patch-repair endonuclease